MATGRRSSSPHPPTAISRRQVLCGIGLGALAAGAGLAAGVDGAFAQALPRPRLPASPPPPIRFEVIRAGEVIGSHNVDFQGSGSDFAVRTTIDIAVRILGVTVFVFRHDGTETWRNGILHAFESKTTDDDSEFFVRGRAEGGVFQITNRKGTETAPAEIMVGSYWAPEIARQRQLIDPQRGRIKTQQLLSTDKMPIQVGKAPVQATRYHVVGVTNGWVAYDDAGRWIAAELKKKGSDILYRLPA